MEDDACRRASVEGESQPWGHGEVTVEEASRLVAMAKVSFISPSPDPC